MQAKAMHHSAPMSMGTQGTHAGDSASQSYEETQIEADILMDPRLLERVDEEDEGDQLQSGPWARLVSLSPLVPQQDLFFEAEGEEGRGTAEGRLGLHALGRSNKCQLVYKQKLISNEHCRIFCLRGSEGHLCPYIEDNSANGTYVNKSTRLKKGVRRVLHNGDLVSLVNPHSSGRQGQGGDVEAASFFVHILLPVPSLAKGEGGGMRSLLSGVLEGGAATPEGNGLEHMRSATVTHLLGQERSIFDYYDQKELLGSGANGQVYRCVHKQDGHEVAVKATNMRISAGGPGGGSSSSSLERVLMEAHMIRALKHENIIALEDVFSDRNTLYLVMELVRGGDLFDRIVSLGRYQEQDAQQVMLQTLSAMEFMHSRNVAHRDMKPENILLLRRNCHTRVKITDFGLAKSATEGGGLKTFCGTPHYLAPEVQTQQASGSGSLPTTTYGFEADMWSLGVIAFVLLTGDYPWSAEPALMCREIAEGRPDFNKGAHVWSTLSPAALSFVQRLVVLEPAVRMTAREALQHPWLHSDSRTLDSPASSNAGGDDDSSMPPPSKIMPPPQPKARGKKRSLESTDFSEGKGVGPSKCSRAQSGSGDQAMELSLSVSASAAPRTRLPRKAKEASIGRYCQKE